MQLEQFEEHMNALERAYEEERRQRDQLQKKYARLKRQYIRLERAHARMILEAHGMNNSASITTTSPRIDTRVSATSSTRVIAREERRSIERLADVIDLTSPTSRRESSTSTNGRRSSSSVSSTPTISRGMRNSLSITRSLSDEICAESPNSPDSEVEYADRMTTRAARASRRQLQFPSTRTNSVGAQENPSRSTLFSERTSNSLTRPRPRLGLDSFLPEQSTHREYEWESERERSPFSGENRSPFISISSPDGSPTGSVYAFSPTTSLRSPSTASVVSRSSGSMASPSTASLASSSAASSPPPAAAAADDDEAASVALAVYLQQQENIAAFEEYMARRQVLAEHESQVTSPRASIMDHRTIDPDNMTYEELLQLGEQNGDVKKERWRQMAVHVLSRLPTHRWNGDHDADITCIICQYNFMQNDRALTLPCAHVFHEECVDGWIRENNSCPLCKLEIADV